MNTHLHSQNAAAPGGSVAETDSFYHLTGQDLHERTCDGTACFVARGAGAGEEPRVYCLGRCFAAPARGLDREMPRVEVHAREACVLGRLARGTGGNFATARAAGAYAALERALAGNPSEVLAAVAKSGLRGRGGAAFSTGRKWAAVAEAPARDFKYVVANADEGDPGAYIDRFIMEGDPHALIEGMAIAAFAVGASRGCIYLRHEYPFAEEALNRALAEARAAGFLGGDICGRGVDFDIEIFVGSGSYLCGEESALLHSIEGVRPEPSIRPPFPTERGLFGRPTLVNNVETLASVPWIVERGGDAYAALGFSQSRGTKALSLNSLFNRPGLYEVEFGTPVRRVVEDLGGGLRRGTLKGVIIGGPLAGIIPPHLLDTPLAFEELRAIGAAVGHGGVVAFDESIPIAALAHHVLAFGAYESCGKCTPCRLGSQRLERIFKCLAAPPNGRAVTRAETTALIETLRSASLCGHGVGLGEFAESAVRYYGEELASCWK